VCPLLSLPVPRLSRASFHLLFRPWQCGKESSARVAGRTQRAQGRRHGERPQGLAGPARPRSQRFLVLSQAPGSRCGGGGRSLCFRRRLRGGQSGPAWEQLALRLGTNWDRSSGQERGEVPGAWIPERRRSRCGVGRGQGLPHTKAAFGEGARAPPAVAVAQLCRPPWLGGLRCPGR
jgi:hypothetical protein